MAERKWPDDWNERLAGRGCPLCAALGQGDNDFVVNVGRRCSRWAVRYGPGFNPVKVNYLTLGDTVPHLHTQVVPRYLDDPAPGGPIEWAQLFSPAPVPDAELRRPAAALRALLAS